MSILEVFESWARNTEIKYDAVYPKIHKEYFMKYDKAQGSKTMSILHVHATINMYGVSGYITRIVTN